MLRISGSFVGAWLSLVERFVRDEEVAGSNPVAPTTPYLFAEQQVVFKI